MRRNFAEDDAPKRMAAKTEEDAGRASEFGAEDDDESEMSEENHDQLRALMRDPQIPLADKIQNIADLIDNDEINIDHRDSEGDNVLSFAIACGEFEVASFLVERGANIDMKGSQGLTSAAFAAIAAISSSQKERAQILFLNILRKKNPAITEQEIAEARKFYLAQAYLNLAYSENNLGFPHDYNLACLVQELALGVKIDDDISAILNIIAAQENFTKDGKRYEVRRSMIDDHASFYVIEFDAETNLPQFLYYVDGNPIIDKRNPAVTVPRKGYGYGVTKYPLDQEKLAELDLEHLPTRNLYNFLDDLEQFENEKKRIEFLDIAPAGTVPEGIIPAKNQNRDNCFLKSLNLLVRLMNHLINGRRIEFNVEQGALEGDGFGSYKAGFKYPLISRAVDIILEVADNGDSLFAGEAEEFLLHSVGPNAKKKLEQDYVDENFESNMFANTILSDIVNYYDITSAPNPAPEPRDGDGILRDKSHSHQPER